MARASPPRARRGSRSSASRSPPIDARFSRSLGRCGRRVGSGSSALRTCVYSRLHRRLGGELEQEDVLARRRDQLLQLPVGHERAVPELPDVAERREHPDPDDPQPRGPRRPTRAVTRSPRSRPRASQRLASDQDLAGAAWAPGPRSPRWRPGPSAGRPRGRRRAGPGAPTWITDPPAASCTSASASSAGFTKSPRSGSAGRAALHVPGPAVEVRGVEQLLQARRRTRAWRRAARSRG